MLTRQATEDDFNFIASSYLKSCRHSPEARHLINELYWDVYKDRLRRMLLNGSVTIGHDPEDTNKIIGYVIVGEPVHGKSVLHYAYIKYQYRGQGVAEALAKAAIPEFGSRMVLCTHTGRKFKDCQEKYKLIYNPEYAK